MLLIIPTVFPVHIIWTRKITNEETSSYVLSCIGQGGTCEFCGFFVLSVYAVNPLVNWGGTAFPFQRYKVGQADRLAERQTDRNTDRPADGQTGTSTYRQTDRQEMCQHPTRQNCIQYFPEER